MLLGAACLLAAGALAARRASRSRFLLVLLGILGAVLVIQLPRLVTDARNGQGIAWEARAGERIVLAEAGVAVTSSDEGRTLTGRDIGNGGGKWEIEFPRDGFAGSEPFVSRVGRTLVVVDRANKLRAIDLGTGRQRWDAPPADGFVLPAIADAEFVAATHCREGGRCTVEVRALRDGSVRWKAPLASNGPWLGSPPIAQALGSDRPIWPASAVIVRVPPGGARYELRELATGKVLGRGTGTDDALGVIGNLFLRQTEDGALSATDVAAGRQVWERPADGQVAARTPEGSLRWLAMPDAALLLGGELRDIEDLALTDTLPILDPRTGRVTERRTGGEGSNSAVVVPLDGPPVTAGTAAAPPAPRMPAIAAYVEDEVLADGRRYRTDRLDRRDIGTTATQVGWGRDVQPFGGGERAGAVVHDRRTGKRLVRYAGESRSVSVRSEGERLVIYDGGRDLVVKP